MKRPGKNASGEEGGKAKARDSSNQSWFKWHWVTEPGVLWLAVPMRHRAVINGPHRPAVNDQQDVLEAAPVVKLATTLGSTFSQTYISRFPTAAVWPLPHILLTLTWAELKSGKTHFEGLQKRVIDVCVSKTFRLNYLHITIAMLTWTIFLHSDRKLRVNCRPRSAVCMQQCVWHVTHSLSLSDYFTKEFRRVLHQFPVLKMPVVVFDQT